MSDIVEVKYSDVSDVVNANYSEACDLIQAMFLHARNGVVMNYSDVSGDHIETICILLM